MIEDIINEDFDKIKRRIADIKIRVEQAKKDNPSDAFLWNYVLEDLDKKEKALENAYAKFLTWFYDNPIKTKRE